MGFCGEAGGAVKEASPAVAQSFNTMRFIVTVGWAIYPAGYFFGYLRGSVSDTILNVVYNIADLVNKIAFVLACWSCAKADSAAIVRGSSLMNVRHLGILTVYPKRKASKLLLGE